MEKSAATTPQKSTVTAKDRALAVFSSLTDLARVEAFIQTKFSSEAPILSEISAYLLSQGGKRMRPALALLSARLFGMRSASEDLIKASAAIELVHMATLMHDDIIDNSLLRRGAPSPLAKYGSSNTLLAGDFLLVRAFSLCAGLDPHIIAESERGCIELTEGEILETPLYQEHHSIESAITIARKKTASLFRLAAHSGAYLADAKEVTEQMSSFGENLGIAFQILDDILDVQSDGNMHGKQTGIDIRERKPSLVNLLWLESGSSLAKRLLRAPIDVDATFVKSALAEIRSGEVLSQARDLASHYINKSKEALQAAVDLSPNPSPDTLKEINAILEYTLERAE
ncbi:MAG: polyprenyl synthetase family protein [Deltaproteobacteria bacterium]|nr:polyprenyl synthetase family protein [Deltaproteobacteria bacterium]